jgi:hypothetical protein
MATIHNLNLLNPITLFDLMDNVKLNDLFIGNPSDQVSNLLLETGDNFLLEDGGYILLE